MALFEKKTKPIEPVNGAEAPDTQAPDRMKEIRNISGFSSLDDVAATAEDLVRDSARKSADRKRISPKQREEMEAAEKAAKRQLALQTLGRFLCRELTVMPYEAWSHFFSDPALRLSPAEAEKLTEAAFLTVQGFDIDFSSPWVGLTGLVLMHGVAVGNRVRHQMEVGAYDDDNKKEKTAEEKVQ